MCTCSSELDSSHCKANSRQQSFCRSFHAATTLTWRNKRYWINDSLDLRRAIRRMRQYIEQFVQKAIASAASTTLKQENKKYNLLSALAEQTQDHEELRNQLLAILVAGRGKHDPQQAIPPNETRQEKTKQLTKEIQTPQPVSSAGLLPASPSTRKSSTNFAPTFSPTFLPPPPPLPSPLKKSKHAATSNTSSTKSSVSIPTSPLTIVKQQSTLHYPRAEDPMVRHPLWSQRGRRLHFPCT